MDRRDGEAVKHALHNSDEHTGLNHPLPGELSLELQMGEQQAVTCTRTYPAPMGLLCRRCAETIPHKLMAPDPHGDRFNTSCKVSWLGHQASKVKVATSRIHNVQLSQPPSVPRPRRMVQLGQQIPHVRPLVRINQPTALDNFPQPLRKTNTLRPLRFWRPITFHDRKYHPTVVCDIRKRNISAKDLMVCESNRWGTWKGHICTNLVYNHPESVAIRLFCWSVIGNSKPFWIEQLRTHPPGGPAGSERHERYF